MFVYIGGIPGVGKTTLIKEILKVAWKAGFPLQSMEEQKILCQLTGKISPAEYRLLPKAVRSEARERMVTYFYKLDREDLKKIRIRDDHFAYLEEDGTYFIRPCKPEDEIQMLAFVVHITSPKNILVRRLRKSSLQQEYNYFDLDKIAIHQEVELKTALSQAEYLKIPIRIFENNEGELLSISQSVFSFIRECTFNLKKVRPQA